MLIVLGFVVLILAAVGITQGAKGSTGSFFSQSDGDNVNSESAPIVPQHIVPTSPSTWPSGDRLWDVARAIAYAEGYNVVNSVPGRLNNPGDISDGASRYGSEAHSGSSVTTFPDATTGWQWLYTKLSNAVSGASSVYSPSMSWYDLGGKWAPPNADVWAENVAGRLGVDPGDVWADYVLG